MRTTPAQLAKVGELEIRPGEGLFANGSAVTLSVREFDLLVSLAHNAGRIVSREELHRTHVGFGYRLDGIPSHPFHTAATTE